MLEDDDVMAFTKFLLMGNIDEKVGMDFKRQPFIDDCKFLFQSFDNTFADVTEMMPFALVPCAGPFSALRRKC
ncbi:MAG: hypothetical protein PVH37_04695 [Desulfobacterales bacterium]